MATVIELLRTVVPVVPGVTVENVIEAVQNISDYIQSYMQARQDDDAAGAAAVRG